MDNKPQKNDPIKNKYFLPLEGAERFGMYVFFLTALFSIVILFIDSTKYPSIYSVIQVLFVVFVILFSLNEAIIRLYLAPRAQSKRFQDFLSHAYEKNLVSVKTDHYYTTHGDNVTNRLAYQLLENSHYSTDTITQMTRSERIKIIAYIIFLLVIILNRDTDLDVIVVIAQVLFSEEIISRWLRMEWLRHQFESVFEGTYRAIQSNSDIDIKILELLNRYETAKANAGITLSSVVFKKREPVTDDEWKQIRINLKI